MSLQLQYQLLKWQCMYKIVDIKLEPVKLELGTIAIAIQPIHGTFAFTFGFESKTTERIANIAGLAFDGWLVFRTVRDLLGTWDKKN